MSQKVERAIIMAAGLGTRLRPITNVIPKPFVEVNGVRMIESIIDGLMANGITEIHVIVGYKKEFACLLERKYPNLDIIENNYYNECNNISSLYLARDYLENAIILDGDQVLYNKDILKPEIECSGYCCTWADKDTVEWILDTDEKGHVIKGHREGGKDGWQLHSVSRWTKEDGQKLKKHLELEFEVNKNRDLYWDDVALFKHPDDYDLQVYPIKPSDIVEIDDYADLVKIDPRYGINLS